LNCWGVPTAAFRKLRFQAIAQELLDSKYHVVLLQEVWTAEDWELVRERVKDSFVFTHRFTSGVMGSGLAILSRFRVLECSFTAFNASGKLYKFWHADALGAKGIASILVSGPEGLKIRILNLHTQAQYKQAPPLYEDAEYMAIRCAQLIQLAGIVRNSQSDAVIVAGDFNSRPFSAEMRAFMAVSGLEDSFASVRGMNFDDPALAGDTSVRSNIFNQKSVVHLETGIPLKRGPFFPSRIDYILFKGSSQTRVSIEKCEICYDDERVTVNARNKVPFSDHSGLWAKLNFHSEESKQSQKDSSSLSRKKAIEDALILMNKSVQQISARTRRAGQWKYAFLSAALGLVILSPMGSMQIVSKAAAGLCISGFLIALGVEILSIPFESNSVRQSIFELETCLQAME